MASASGGVQVFFHLTVRNEDERVLETTRLSEDGVEGSGVPRVYMLGKGQRMPRGWELALYGRLLLACCPVLVCMHWCNNAPSSSGQCQSAGKLHP